jgi:hypothetical protein
MADITQIGIKPKGEYEKLLLDDEDVIILSIAATPDGDMYILDKLDSVNETVAVLERAKLMAILRDVEDYD